MDVDQIVMVRDTAGYFEFIPLLDTLEGQCTYLNVRTLLYQHATGEEAD